MADQPSGTTSYEVRAELEKLLERDLLGPWSGSTEELPPGVPPAERYILGRLVPRTRPGDDPAPVEKDMAAIGDDPDTADDGEPDDGTDVDERASPQAVRTGSMSASAMGLSFTVPADVQRVVVTASWGRYASVLSEHHETDQGRPRMVSRRTPCGGSVEIELVDGRGDPHVPDAEHEGVVVRATVRRREKDTFVALALINDQGHDGALDTLRLYQAGLSVTALDGAAAIFVGHNDPELTEPPSTADDERRQLELLYRSRRKYAYGRQCAVDADVREGEIRAWQLRTTSFPAADVPLTEAGGGDLMPGAILDMTSLGSQNLTPRQLGAALRPLATGYQTWLAQQRGRLNEPEIARYAPSGEHALDLADDLALRLGRAVDLLESDGAAREAFRFANQAMALQRVRTQVTRERTAHPERTAAELVRELDVPKNRSWRPFQLAFVLLCLPGLTDPDHVDAHRGIDDGQVQLLFFPTGGGKTEAYLGLTAYTLAIRRLQGTVGTGSDARDGTDGVAVLMRYTLRLLTAQQFQRASALVCACETLRRERIAGGDGRWGSTPFRIGLWVGSSVSPNSFDRAKEDIERARGQDAEIGGPLQLAVCPWCGTALSPGGSLRSDSSRRRTLIYCADPEGQCEFTENRSPDEGLPVLTVDEEIYRLTPSLVIATVDKLAQLPWKAATATLFGLVDQRCPRHGWMTPDLDKHCTGTHNKVRNLPATRPEPAPRLRPPDLIIQDELHLISDALGSMVGLYEAVVDDLCTRTQSGRAVRPVLVASTATVRRARDQVRQVFARDLAVFPPQVLDAGETFFSTVVPPSPTSPSRRYRGICATGERLKAIEIRVASAVMEHGQYLLDRHGAAADPYMTVVDYFTSTRELAGMRRLVDDDVSDRLSSQKVHTRRRRPALAELTSRMPSSRISTALGELEREFGHRDTTDGIAAQTEALREARRTGGAAPTYTDRPLDVLLATSMLQVGVDVQRLGLMLVTGQPKNTAEYIQVTSRVGRDSRRPGLVLTVYQWSRPRDLGHYEDFAYDHATFGMRVEGLTTTPFSDRSLDRGLSAVLVAALRHSRSDALPNTAAGTVDLFGASVDRVRDLLVTRAEKVTGDNARVAEIKQQITHRLDSWKIKRKNVQSGRLGYQRANDVTGLLHQPDEGEWETWTAPMSLREVEPEVLLQIDRRDRSADGAPGWVYTNSEEDR